MKLVLAGIRRLVSWVNAALQIVETDPTANAEYDRIDRDLDGTADAVDEGEPVERIPPVREAPYPHPATDPGIEAGDRASMRAGSRFAWRPRQESNLRPTA